MNRELLEKLQKLGSGKPVLRVTCPTCGEETPGSQVVCRECGVALAPKEASEVSRESLLGRLRSMQKEGGHWWESSTDVPTQGTGSREEALSLPPVKLGPAPRFNLGPGFVRSRFGLNEPESIQQMVGSLPRGNIESVFGYGPEVYKIDPGAWSSQFYARFDPEKEAWYASYNPKKGWMPVERFTPKGAFGYNEGARQVALHMSGGFGGMPRVLVKAMAKNPELWKDPGFQKRLRAYILEDQRHRYRMQLYNQMPWGQQQMEWLRAMAENINPGWGPISKRRATRASPQEIMGMDPETAFQSELRKVMPKVPPPKKAPIDRDVEWYRRTFSQKRGSLEKEEALLPSFLTKPVTMGGVGRAMKGAVGFGFGKALPFAYRYAPAAAAAAAAGTAGFALAPLANPKYKEKPAYTPPTENAAMLNRKLKGSNMTYGQASQALQDEGWKKQQNLLGVSSKETGLPDASNAGGISGWFFRRLAPLVGRQHAHFQASPTRVQEGWASKAVDRINPTAGRGERWLQGVLAGTTAPAAAIAGAASKAVGAVGDAAMGPQQMTETEQGIKGTTPPGAGEKKPTETDAERIREITRKRGLLPYKDARGEWHLVNLSDPGVRADKFALRAARLPKGTYDDTMNYLRDFHPALFQRLAYQNSAAGLGTPEDWTRVQEEGRTSGNRLAELTFLQRQRGLSAEDKEQLAAMKQRELDYLRGKGTRTDLGDLKDYVV